MTITPDTIAAMRADAHAALTLADNLSIAARSPLTASFACYEQCDDWTVDAGAFDNVATFSYGDGDARFFVGAVANVPALAGHVAALTAEVERLQALLAPTRGDLLVAYASAGAARVEAAAAFERARLAAAHSTKGRQAAVYYDADQRLRAAVEDEAAKRATLDAFERAHGLDLTHPDAVAEPCPGSRGW